MKHDETDEDLGRISLFMHPDNVKVPNRIVDMDSWIRSACYP